ncbi:MAG: 16S rRNA (adenine(1518)-N(6)/adenine(1519)-N(6))-dimethyltransferase RsmA [Anaerolineae bacterium]|jgi:16S rRNA (adenine1518-N6/adenine1519-N6)-dimethyltransferase
MEDVRALLARYKLTPSKGLGQNLLTSGAVYERIVEAAELSADDAVLEIGPGLGTLTRRLAARAGVVAAIELDRKMVAILQQELAAVPNVHIVLGDALELDPAETLRQAGADLAGGYKVVANLPYYITSRALRHLLAESQRPRLLVLMVQREVADRLRAQPGNHSLLSLSVQAFGRVEQVCRVPASAFYPQPKVASAVVRVIVDEQPAIDGPLQAAFFQVLRAGFGQKRKQLHNSLSANLNLSAAQAQALLSRAGIPAAARPQALSLDQWRALAEAFAAADG